MKSPCQWLHYINRRTEDLVKEVSCLSPFKNERFYIRRSEGLPPEAEEFLNFHSWRRLIFGPLYHESSRCAFSGWKKSTRQFGEWNLTFTRQAIFFTRQWRVVKPFSPPLFLSLLGALLFSKRALKAKRHNCGHRDIISWYAGSMWQRNVGTKYYVWTFLILISFGAL